MQHRFQFSFKRGRNFRLAYALKYREHTPLREPDVERIVRRVLFSLPAYDGSIPVHVAIENETRIILEEMRRVSLSPTSEG